jgi:hypothetical protein
MEKIIYVLQRDPAINIEEYSRRLRHILAERLRKLGAHGVQVNVADHAVAPAAGLRQGPTRPPPEAVLNIWIDSAIAKRRQPVDEAIAEFSPVFWAYLVTESVPVRNTGHPPKPGARTEGFAQMAFLRLPQRLGYDAWLDMWQNTHTDVAIETQSGFEYVQNIVVRRLSGEGPQFVAIVEECFPEGAMNDYRMLFDAPDDDEKFKRNLRRMMESVNRFIDADTVDIIPTSQYVIFTPWR